MNILLFFADDNNKDVRKNGKVPRESACLNPVFRFEQTNQTLVTFFCLYCGYNVSFSFAINKRCLPQFYYVD